MTCPRTTIRLPATEASPRLARDEVRRALGGKDDIRASVVVSELVTNAVLHASSAPELTVALVGSMLRVEVADESPGRPELQRGTREGETCGRGMALVTALALRWGVRPAGAGKVVWAEVEVGAAGR